MANTYVDFSGRDYTTILERLQSKQVEEVPELTDFNYSDAGQFLLRRLASEIDYLHFFLDEAFYENFLLTAEHRQSLIDLSKLIDWPIRMPSSASCTIRLTRIDGVISDISIPRYSSFYKADGTPYMALYNYTMDAEVDVLDIEAVQGTRQYYTIREDEFSVDDNLGLLTYSLGSDIAANSCVVISGEDFLEWTLVDSFWRSTVDDSHFMMDFLSDPEDSTNDTCRIVLGPCGFPTGDTFNVYFTRTVGLSGNTGIGIINVVGDALINKVTCTNTTAATGGSDIEDNAVFSNRMAEAVRTQRRAVTVEDYEAIVTSIPGVKYCQAIDRNYFDDWPHLYIGIYVAPYGGLTISDTLSEEILTELTDKGSYGSWPGRYVLMAPTAYTVNISARIGLLTGHNATTVINALTIALTAYFDSMIFGIGEPLDFGDLNVVASRVTGVRWIEFDSPTTTISLPYGQIIQLGTISITVA